MVITFPENIVFDIQYDSLELPSAISRDAARVYQQNCPQILLTIDSTNEAT